MNQRILVTGSSGLVGTAIRSLLAAKGIETVCLDLKAQGASCGDVRNKEDVRRLMVGVDGVIHLAAVSRVVWGQKNPELCWETNVTGVKNVLDAAGEASSRPWVISASSREVYGDAEHLPVSEDMPLRPVNIYGRSKAEGERLVAEAAKAGMNACTIRLSNVYGSVDDHEDRVVPAFARAAAFGKELRVQGEENTFDFTYIDDVARGIVLLAEFVAEEKSAPSPVHFVTGRPTTLGQLADKAIRIGAPGCRKKQEPSRNYDVARFYGNPERAGSLLGWKPTVFIDEGLARLVNAFRDSASRV